jgi:hypothetical protein
MINRDKLYIFLLILTLFCNCKNKNIEYYENGNIKEKFFTKMGILKESFDNKKIQTILKQLADIEIDSSTILYFKDIHNQKKQIDIYYKTEHKQIIIQKNGLIEREGFIKNGNPIFKWKFYGKTGKLELIRDFEFIKGKPFINQERYYNSEEELTYRGNGFIEIKHKDTIKLNNEFRAVINLPIPFYKNEKSKILVCLSKNTIDFNDDFSNEDEIEKVYFYSFNTEQKNKKWITGVNFNHSAVIGRKYNQSGNKLMKGIIYEYLASSKDSLNSIKKKYFKIPFYVTKE